jgi:hypothetical protein
LGQDYPQYATETAWETGLNSLHRKLQDWTESLIGNTTEDQKRRLAEYSYNRSLFMLMLETPGVSLEQKLACYKPIEDAFDKIYPPNHPQLLQKKAQISNMRGCIIIRSGQNDARVIAEPYFEKAYKLYSSIPSTRDTIFLKGNAITGLIGCLADIPLNQERALRLQGYAKELREIYAEYQENADLHCYVAEYPKSIQQVDDALERYRALQLVVSGAK